MRRSNLVKEWGEAGAIVSLGVALAGFALLFKFRWFFLTATVVGFILWSI